MEFSEEFDTSYNKENPTKLFLSFNDLPDSQIMVKVGVSVVSSQNAKENLLSEANHWDFDKYLSSSKNEWNKALSKIDISSNNDSLKEIFYTALYHTMIAPNLVSDVNGDYRATDMQVHNDSLANYTVFSLWDTFRSTHPLYNLIERKKTALFLNTFLNQYQFGGQLPIWELCANYTGCMIGYHVVSVILDAYVKSVEFELDSQLGSIIPGSEFVMIYTIENKGNVDVRLFPSFVLPQGIQNTQGASPLNLDIGESKVYIISLYAGPNSKSGQITVNMDNGSE